MNAPTTLLARVLTACEEEVQRFLVEEGVDLITLATEVARRVLALTPGAGVDRVALARELRGSWDASQGVWPDAILDRHLGASPAPVATAPTNEPAFVPYRERLENKLTEDLWSWIAAHGLRVEDETKDVGQHDLWQAIRDSFGRHFDHIPCTARPAIEPETRTITVTWTPDVERIVDGLTFAAVGTSPAKFAEVRPRLRAALVHHLSPILTREQVAGTAGDTQAADFLGALTDAPSAVQVRAEVLDLLGIVGDVCDEADAEAALEPIRLAGEARVIARLESLLQSNETLLANDETDLRRETENAQTRVRDMSGRVAAQRERVATVRSLLTVAKEAGQ